MDKKIQFYILYILIIPLFVFSLDQIIKSNIQDLIAFKNFGPFIFMDIHNKGFFIGSFHDIHPLIRIMSTSVFFGFLFFCFVLIQYFLIPDMRLLRAALSSFMGGIAGNAFDRAFLGYVRDFFSFYNDFFLNIADLVIFSSAFLIIYSIFKYKDIIWHPNCIRKDLLIYPHIQLLFSIRITTISFAFALIVSLFSIGFMKSYSFPTEYIKIYLIILSGILGVFLIIIFVVGIFISHRNVGAIFSFERYIKDLMAGKTNKSLSLRKGDDYKHLELLAEDIKKSLSK